jgi:hypothetical protein
MRRNSRRKLKSLINCQKINKRGFVNDIDDKLALMKINVVSDSEEDSDEMINPVKSDEISMKQPSEISNVSTSHQMAKRIVDQMKEILLQQFQKTFNRDQYIHEGIECSECHVISIVGTRFKSSPCL